MLLIGHASKCLPLITANQMGWVIRNPANTTVLWNGGNGLEDLSVLVEDDIYSKHITSHFGHGILTFQIPYLFNTSENIGLFVRGCTNFWIENAQALDGFVETYWSNYSFTMNWKIIKPDIPVKFNKGDPICMIIPYPINILEDVNVSVKKIQDEKEINDLYIKWSAYRNSFNKNKERKNTDWQKDYFLGKKCPFKNNDDKSNIAENHKTKFKLPKFFKD